MKKLLVFAAFLMTIQFVYAQEGSRTKSDETIQSDQIRADGIVMQKGGIWIIRVNQQDSDVDYVPSNLTADYQEEGLKVVFSATLDAVPGNVRMAGAPVTLVSIEKQ